MFWPVMFEAASNVGPEGPLKKMPILVLEIPGHTASSHALTASTQAQQTADSRQQTAHEVTKFVAHRRELQQKNPPTYVRTFASKKKKKCSSWKGVPHLRRQLASNVSK